MDSKKTTTIRITDETRKVLDELKNKLGRSIMWIVHRASKNYYSITLGNRLPKKE